PPKPLAVAPRHDPERQERGRQPKRQWISRPGQSRTERNTQIVELLLERHDRWSPADLNLAGECLGVGEQPPDETTRDLLGLPALFESFAREVANRLDHRETLPLVAHEALVDDRLERLERGAADLLGRRERASAPEHRQPREEPLLLGLEQGKAPIDRR